MQASNLCWANCSATLGSMTLSLPLYSNFFLVFSDFGADSAGASLDFLPT